MCLVQFIDKEIEAQGHSACWTLCEVVAEMDTYVAVMKEPLKRQI